MNCKISLTPSPNPREWHPWNALSSVSGMFLNPFGKCWPAGVARRLCWTAGPVRPLVTMEQPPKVQSGPGPRRCGFCLGPWTPLDTWLPRSFPAFGMEQSPVWLLRAPHLTDPLSAHPQPPVTPPLRGGGSGPLRSARNIVPGCWQVVSMLIGSKREEWGDLKPRHTPRTLERRQG